MLTGITGLVTGARLRAAAVCLALLGAGCYATLKPVQPPPGVEREKANSLPIWITDPSQGLEPGERGKNLAAVGVCAYRGNIGHSRLSAKAQARSELAQIAGAYVESVFTDFAEEQAVFTDPESSRSEQLTKSFTRVSASRHLSHSQVVRYHRDDAAKQLYVLIRISKQDLAKAVAGSAEEMLASVPAAEKGDVLKGDPDDMVKAFANAIVDSGP